MKGLSDIFAFIDKPSEKDLKFYQKCYENVRNRRDLFHKAINVEENRENLENAAFGFLYTLRLFRRDVPKKIRKKMEYECFEKTEELAKILLEDYLNKTKTQK